MRGVKGQVWRGKRNGGTQVSRKKGGERTNKDRKWKVVTQEHIIYKVKQGMTNLKPKPWQVECFLAIWQMTYHTLPLTQWLTQDVSSDFLVRHRQALSQWKQSHNSIPQGQYVCPLCACPKWQKVALKLRWRYNVTCEGEIALSLWLDNRTVSSKTQNKNTYIDNSKWCLLH